VQDSLIPFVTVTYLPAVLMCLVAAMLAEVWWGHSLPWAIYGGEEGGNKNFLTNEYFMSQFERINKNSKE